MKRMPTLLLALTLLMGLAAPAFPPVHLWAPGVAAAAAPETRLMRYPDISKDHVVFVYAADLWISPRAGGPARRLTTHPGDELFPKFSPDGKWIAFTGEY